MTKFKETYNKEQCTMSAMWPHCKFCSGMCQERAKDFAERKKEELKNVEVPEAFKVPFYKKDMRWYADVPNHTEEENEMVCGADTMLEMLADGADKVGLLITFKPLPDSKPLCFYMKEHDDDGAWYYVTGNEKEYGEVWICNVTHDVLGEHPQEFYAMVDNTEEEYKPWLDPVDAVTWANQMAADDIINDCLNI